MKSMFGLVCCMFLATILPAQMLHPDDAASKVLFTIKNFGINTAGSLSGLKGEIVVNEQDCTNDYFNVTVNTATVNTGIGARDHHLRSVDYFNVAVFPTIQFISESVQLNKADGQCWVTGKLTIKGITRIITFPFTVIHTAIGYRLQGQFSINRLDYGVGSSSWALANSVIVQLNVLAVPTANQ
ncbi:YceI family protein [Hydrotalea flava]|uniref:YceI family protein n=1 Tax=Hydrotalea flava TaxID=714549 RepID=UPI0008296D47|nr:YceI family protein [Hydrotalea flava]